MTASIAAEIEIKRTAHDTDAGRVIVESCTPAEAEWDGSSVSREPGWVASRVGGLVLAYRVLPERFAAADGR